MKKQKEPDKKALGMALCKAVGEYLDAHGWRVGTVGPCEVQLAGHEQGDPTGRTLDQYRFVTKFYGMRKPLCGEEPS